MHKNMQKQATIIMLTFVFALVVCGAVAAADNSTVNATNASSVSSTNAAPAPAPAPNQPTVNAPTASDQQASSTPATTSGGDPRIVGDPTCYTTIQDAVNHAIKGDVIIVDCGVYNENVVINTMLTLIGQEGAVVVADNSNKPVFKINSGGSGTTITGFTIMGGSDGIELNGVSDCEISDNTIVSNKDGIELNNADFNCIKDNEIKYNLDDGISLRNSEGNTIKDNKITSNGDDGISLYRSEGNKITDNKINSNLDDGVSLDNSDWNDIIGNEINKNYYDGVVLYESDGNLVKCNDIIDNQGKGVLIAGSKGNEILKNDIETCIPCSVCIYVKDTCNSSPRAELTNGRSGRVSELNEVHGNCLIATGENSYAIINNSCKKLDAQCNWFGSAKDPKCKIGGSGVTLYCPWLKEEPKQCGCHQKEKKSEKTTTKKSAKTAKAAKVTAAAGVPMQTTGAPLALLALALLAVFGGLLPRRK